MKSKVILFCVLLFSSNIVDSNPHSEGLLRQRVNQPSIWQGNQNTQDAQYLDTDFTQTRKINTLTNSAIQQESLQDYNVNQGRHNYNGYSYNKSPASSSSGQELLESYNLQTDGRRLESYPPRVESYPPRVESYPPRVESYPSEVGFDNQPFRKQNWRPQNLYTNSVPSAVLITDNERPLVNTVQEPYRAPVQYLQPKYVSSSNERFYQPDRSYLTREQIQYPLANNVGDSYIENSRSRFGSSGPVPHENYSESQARASEIKTKITDGKRYLHNLAPQSGNYNEIPIVIATDSLTDQSENIKYLENYRSRSDLSNTASSNSYVDSSPVVENYRLDSRSSNVPESHERLSGERRHTQSFAPQSGIIYNESPAVTTRDTLEDQFKNIKSVENFRSRSDLSNTASSTSYEDSSPVVENYRLDSRSSNIPESHERLSGDRRHTQNFAPQSEIIYNESPTATIRDTLEDQFKNIKSVENYRSRSDLSNTASSTRYEDSSPVVENYRLDSRQSIVPESHERISGERRHTQTFAPQSGIVYNESPAVITTDTLEDQFKNIKSVENYRSRSDLSETVPTTNYNDDSPVKSAAQNYNLHSSPNSGLGSYESYNDAQTAVSEVNPRPIEAKKYVQNFAPQSRTIYYDNPAVIATDDLADQSTNINKERENYKSRSDLSSTASTTNYDDNSTVITIVETYNEGSRPINIPVPHSEYENSRAALSEERPSPIGSQNYLHKVAPQPKIIYNDVPIVVTTDVLADQSNNIRYEKREDYKSRPDLSNLAPGTNQDDSFPYTSTVDNSDSDSKPSNPVPETVEKRSPLDVNNVLSDKPLARRYAHNYRTATGPSNTVFDNSFNDAPNVISETVDEKSGVNEDNYGKNEPIPINSKTSPISTHTEQTNQKVNKNEESDMPSYESRSPTPPNNPNHHQIKELNLNKFNIKKLMDGSSKPYLVIHPNGTIEQLDTIDLDSQQNSYLRLVNTKRINVGDTEGDETHLPKIAPNNVAKTFVPLNETPLPADTQPALQADQSNSKPPHVKQQTEGDNLKSVASPVNQPVDDGNLKLPLFNQQEDDDNFKPLRPFIRHRTHHHKSKPTDVNQLAFEKKSNPSIQDGNLLAFDKSKPQNLNENQSDDNDFYLSSPDENQPSGINNANLPLTENQPENDKNSQPLSHISPYKKWPHIHHHKSKLSNDNQPTENNDSNSSLRNEDQSLDDNYYKTLSLNEKQQIDNHHHTSKHSHLNQPRDVEIVSLSPSKYKLDDDNDSNSSSPVNNKSTDDNDSKLSNESQPGNKLKPIHPHYLVHYNEPKLTNKNQSKHDKNKSENDKNSNLSSLDENKSSDDDIFSTNKPKEDIKSKPLSIPERPLALHNKPKLPHNDQSEIDSIFLQNKPEDDKIPNSSSLDQNKSTDDDNFSTNKPEEDIKTKPLRQSAPHNEPTLSQKDQSEIDIISPQNKLEDDNNSNLRSPSNKQSTDDDTSENKPEDNNKSKLLNLHKEKHTHHNKPKLSHEDKSENVEDFSKGKPRYDDNSNTSSPDDDEPIDDDTFFESQLQNNKEIKPKTSYDDQSENDDTSPQNQPEDDDDSNSWIPDDNESIEDDFLENQSEEDDDNPEDDIDSNSPLAGENGSGQNKKTKPLPKSKRQPTVSKTDDQPVSTTLSLATPNYTKSPKPQVAKKHKHTSQKSATTPLIVTTPYPDETSEDQIITLSPIEQVTDNVSDIPPMTTTTTTAKPIESPGKSKKQKNSVNSSSEDFASITDKVRTPTKASTSSLTTLPDSTSDDKTTKGTVLSKKTHNKVESQASNVKIDAQTIQSAVYDSSELLDTDVLAESDDNSPITKSPSVLSDVNTGEASGANTLEFEQTETDIIITVSISTNNDFEDDIITINVEVFESPGLFSNNKSLLVNIDTSNASDDESETPLPSDCEKPHNDKEDGRGKNLEIDLSNLKGEPTMWIRTTNQDFIDKLINKNDTVYDMIYFFNLVTEPVIEREKVTTIHCNGTVVIETKETTYARKDDPTPTIVKTTQTLQIEDYQRNGQDSLNE